MLHTGPSRRVLIIRPEPSPWGEKKHGQISHKEPRMNPEDLATIALAFEDVASEWVRTALAFNDNPSDDTASAAHNAYLEVSRAFNDLRAMSCKEVSAYNAKRHAALKQRLAQAKASDDVLQAKDLEALKQRIARALRAQKRGE